MEKIIDAVEPTLIEKELSQGCFLRDTNNGGNQLYTFTAHTAPNAMRELGRLREEAFREAGGGTGKAMDIDAHDTCENPYHQLIVWDPEERMILGGYRYTLPSAGRSTPPSMATSDLFHLSEKFQRDYLPWTIELGRSFVQPAYQSSRLRRKGLYALDNLWDGLGALVVLHSEARYFFGKVTMYPSYSPAARNALQYFLLKYFADQEQLVTPHVPVDFGMNLSRLEALFTGTDYREDYEILIKFLGEHGEKFPPLIKSYVNLSPTMRIFGTAINEEFGDVEETGILVTIADIYEEKIERHTANFTPPGL